MANPFYEKWLVVSAFKRRQHWFLAPEQDGPGDRRGRLQVSNVGTAAQCDLTNWDDDFAIWEPRENLYDCFDARRHYADLASIMGLVPRDMLALVGLLRTCSKD